MTIYFEGRYDRVEVNRKIFSGGEVNVRLPRKPGFGITAHLNSSDDVMALLMTADAIKRAGCSTHRMVLTIPYFPYARQDRVCNSGEALSVKVMADLINSLGYSRVRIFDPHSDVTPALLNNCSAIPMNRWVKQVLDEADHPVTLVAPDAGAGKKVLACAKEFGLPMITATKVRDPETMEILETQFDEALIDSEQTYLICDDICDGGRTFIALAEKLCMHGATKVWLYVTHGIFSQGVEALNGSIDRIYCTNSLNQAPQLPADALITHYP